MVKTFGAGVSFAAKIGDVWHLLIAYIKSIITNIV